MFGAILVAVIGSTFKNVAPVVEGLADGYVGYWEHSFAINRPGSLIAVGCPNCGNQDYGLVYTYYDDGQQ